MPTRLRSLVRSLRTYDLRALAAKRRDCSNIELLLAEGDDGGDDCVAIKSGWDCFGVAYGKPSRNITIRDVNCTGSKAGIAIGSEMSGGVEDVLVQRVNILGKANGIAHVKTGVAP